MQRFRARSAGPLDHSEGGEADDCARLAENDVGQVREATVRLTRGGIGHYRNEG